MLIYLKCKYIYLFAFPFVWLFLPFVAPGKPAFAGPPSMHVPNVSGCGEDKRLFKKVEEYLFPGSL